MALFTLVAITAALTGHAQDPSLDLQIAMPVLTEGTLVPVARQAPAQTSSSSRKRVSVKFKNAKPSEVLGWLDQNGANFLIRDEDLKDSGTITLNVEEMPIETVLEAIAGALDGHWENRNGIRVFRKGLNFYTFGASPLPGEKLPAEKMSLAVPGTPLPPMSTEKWSDFQKRMETMEKELERKFGPEFQEKIRSTVEIQTLPPLTAERVKGQGKALGPKEIEKLQQSADKMRVEAMKLAEVARADAVKAAEGARIDALKAAEEARRYAPPAKTTREKTITVPGQRYSIATIPGRAFGDRLTFIAPSFPVDGIDLGKFMKSLSSSQRDLQSKRGYIRYDDLTREQKALLGVRPEGKFEITFKVNQDAITIRG